MVIRSAPAKPAASRRQQNYLSIVRSLDIRFKERAELNRSHGRHLLR